MLSQKAFERRNRADYQNRSNAKNRNRAIAKASRYVERLNVPIELLADFTVIKR